MWSGPARIFPGLRYFQGGIRKYFRRKPFRNRVPFCKFHCEALARGILARVFILGNRLLTLLNGLTDNHRNGDVRYMGEIRTEGNWSRHSWHLLLCYPFNHLATGRHLEVSAESHSKRREGFLGRFGEIDGDLRIIEIRRKFQGTSNTDHGRELQLTCRD